MRGVIKSTRATFGAFVAVGLLVVSASAHGAERCKEGMIVELSGNIKEVRPNRGGGLTVFLLNGNAACLEKTGHIAVDKPIQPSCRVGAKLAAKVSILDMAGEFWYADRTISYSCN